MLDVPPSWTIVKTPSLRVVRVVVSCAAMPPRPRALPSWTITPPCPWTPWRLSRPFCWNSRTTLTWRPVWEAAGIALSRRAIAKRATAMRERDQDMGRGPLPRDLGLFGQPVPDGYPLRHRQAHGPRLLGDLGGEGLPHLVVVPDLEPVLPVERVLGRAGAAKDVHRADVPLVERRLRLDPRGGIPGQLRDPELAVADVELLLLEDALDGPRPRAVGAVPHVFELVPRPAVHAEVEEDEVGPGVDRVVEDVHALVGADAARADVRRGVDAHGEGLVVGPHVRVHVDAEICEKPVHDGRVPVLVLDDLGDHVLLLDPGRLHDPRHVAVSAGQLGVGLHGHEVYEALPVLLRHLLRRFDALAALDPCEELHFAHALAHGALLSTTRTALPSLRGMVLGGTMATSGLRPRWARSSSRTRSDRAITSGRVESKPPHSRRRASEGSTWTSMAGKPWLRSTMS